MYMNEIKLSRHFDVWKIYKNSIDELVSPEMGFSQNIWLDKLFI